MNIAFNDSGNTGTKQIAPVLPEPPAPHHTVQDREEPASATDIAHPGITAQAPKILELGHLFPERVVYLP